MTIRRYPLFGESSELETILKIQLVTGSKLSLSTYRRWARSSVPLLSQLILVKRGLKLTDEEFLQFCKDLTQRSGGVW